MEEAHAKEVTEVLILSIGYSSVPIDLSMRSKLNNTLAQVLAHFSVDAHVGLSGDQVVQVRTLHAAICASAAHHLDKCLLRSLSCRREPCMGAMSWLLTKVPLSQARLHASAGVINVLISCGGACRDPFLEACAETV